MKKTIVFVAVLSAFLMLSMTWLTPIQVKASELQTTEEIEDKLNELGQRLGKDENVAQLIQLHSCQEIEDIFTNLFLAETNEEIRFLADSYVEMLGKNQLNNLINNINEDFSEDIDTIVSSLKHVFADASAKGDIKYYRVEEVKNKLDVTKIDDIELKDNALVFSTQGEIIFPNGKILTQIDWQKISDFLWVLAEIGIAVEFAGLIITYIGFFLWTFGFENIGDILINFGQILGLTAGLFGIACIFLSAFFENLAESEGAREAKPKFLYIFEKFRYNLLVMLKHFLQKIIC